MDAAAVKSKIKSLRSYYSKERQKVLKKKSGSATEENYSSSWFAYKSLLFISDSTTPRETRDSEEHDNPTSVNNNENVSYFIFKHFYIYQCLLLDSVCYLRIC